MIANRYFATVYECAIHIYGNIVSRINISPIIADKRNPDRYICASFSKQLFSNTYPLLKSGRPFHKRKLPLYRLFLEPVL